MGYLMLADKIANAELEVMRILWKKQEPVSSLQIRKELDQTKGWGKSTVLTLLRRLTDKEVITAHKREVLYYNANITEEEYTTFHMEEMVDKLYQGSAKSLVAALVEHGKLSDEDINELSQYFKMEGPK